jgi:hypothetical protein
MGQSRVCWACWGMRTTHFFYRRSCP